MPVGCTDFTVELASRMDVGRMALDLRAPGGSCRSWMRRELLAYERRGVVDATEERHPAHFHVVVYREP